MRLVRMLDKDPQRLAPIRLKAAESKPVETEPAAGAPRIT